MATLRYIAYLAEDPVKLVDFYQRFLGTEELAELQRAISRSLTASTI